MDPSEQCPEPGTWKTFLDGELLDEASADLAAHLEECEACQETLERLAAGKETWEGTAQQLAEADANAEQLESSGHLRDVLNDLKQGVETDSRAASITPESLTFLSESDEEDSIGKLGNYEVLEIVGAGGMGIVMRAWDPSLRRIVAIKVLASHLANSAAARRRFVREAQAAAAVSHDHVVAIHAVEADREPPYLVMQYIEGKTLQQRLDSVGPLHVREVLRIGQQTALGLAAAHQQGIVHRDIKPANILLENGVERVRITDFGLARAIDDASMTQSGVVAGTPLFMAPEQAQGIQLDHRADLFSLGSVLYVMCTGRPPFRSSTMIGVIRRVCDDSPRPIREINPDVPEWLCVIIDRLLAKDPKDRYASADEVAELLGSCLAHVQQPTVVPLPKGLTASSPSSPETIDQNRTLQKAPEAGSKYVDQPKDSSTVMEPVASVTTATLQRLPVTPSDIRREVFWPAILVITGSVSNILMTIYYVLPHLQNQSISSIGYLISHHAFTLFALAIIVFGAVSVIRLQSRVWGIVSAVVSLLIWPHFPVAWPAGIWMLAVLRLPHVQREFVRVSHERNGPGKATIGRDQFIPGCSRQVVTFGKKIARLLLLIEVGVAACALSSAGLLAEYYIAPNNLFLTTTAVVGFGTLYSGIALYRYGFGSSETALERSRQQIVSTKLRWVGLLAGLIPCILIVTDLTAMTYSEILSSLVGPGCVIGIALLLAIGILNLNHARANYRSGKRLDRPLFALLEWPIPLLAILLTVFAVWSDFQGTVGYVQFQIDDPHSMVTLRSSDSRISQSQRGGWRKLRIPEGKYYWTVSDPGILDDHAANGTVDIESSRTSVIDTEIHRGNALERSEGYWRCISTSSVLNGGGVEDCEWATSPGWIAIDEQFLLSWDASGKLIGNWSLKRNADSSPKTLEIVDILTGDSIGEGQWAVGQKKLLLRLYPPRKTTSPYLSSIFSKPTNGDLLEWRFEKMTGPPGFLRHEIAAESATTELNTDYADFTGSTTSELDGRWIPQSMTVAESLNVNGFAPDNREWIIAGDWILFVDRNGKTNKGLISTKNDVTPPRIIVQSQQGSVLWVMVGVYRRVEERLECCFLIPEKSAAEDDNSTNHTNRPEGQNVEFLTDSCFDDPPTPGRIVLRFQQEVQSDRVDVDDPVPEVEGRVLDTKQFKGRDFVEISVGSDDGLRNGHQLIIYRTSKSNEQVYIGRLRLELVTPDRAVGVVLERRKGQQVEREDRVTTEPL